MYKEHFWRLLAVSEKLVRFMNQSWKNFHCICTQSELLYTCKISILSAFVFSWVLFSSGLHVGIYLSYLSYRNTSLDLLLHLYGYNLKSAVCPNFSLFRACFLQSWIWIQGFWRPWFQSWAQAPFRQWMCVLMIPVNSVQKKTSMCT